MLDMLVLVFFVFFFQLASSLVPRPALAGGKGWSGKETVNIRPGDYRLGCAGYSVG